jgi:outer membrane biosynthesis protein TonB
VPPPDAEAADFEEAAEVILDSGDVEPPAPPAPPPPKPAPEEPEPDDVTPPVPDRPTAHEKSASAPPSSPARPAAPPSAPLAECARCTRPIAAAQVLSGEAARRNGLLLCSDCLAHLPPEESHMPDSTAGLLRELLAEVRRLGRRRHAGALSLTRLMTYLLQAGAVFCAVGMTFLSSDRGLYLQIAIFLQLLVVTILFFERNS